MKWLMIILSIIFVMTTISATTFGYNYLDNQDVGASAETNYSEVGVNDSFYLRGLSPQEVADLRVVEINDTQFETGEPITIKTSWLESFVNALSKWANYWTKTENINATGYNITADYLVGDGSQLTNLPSSGGDYPPERTPMSGFLYTLPGWTILTQSTQASLNHLYYIPIWVDRTRTYDQIMVQVTAAGAGGTRMGIYTSVADRPHTLIEDFGTVLTNTTGTKKITINLTLDRGQYYLAWVGNASTTYRCAGTTSFPNIQMYRVNDGSLVLSGDAVWMIANQQALVGSGFPANAIAPNTADTFSRMILLMREKL
jgi:hypothetical protein